jgi:hypothetical protein
MENEKKPVVTEKATTIGCFKNRHLKELANIWSKTKKCQ